MAKAYVLINADTAYGEIVVDRLNELNSVVEVHEVLGPFDVVAEVEAGEIQEIIHILRHQIRIIEGVRNTTTCVIVE